MEGFVFIISKAGRSVRDARLSLFSGFRCPDCRPALLSLDVARQAAVAAQIPLNLVDIEPHGRAQLDEGHARLSQICQVPDGDVQMTGKLSLRQPDGRRFTG